MSVDFLSYRKERLSKIYPYAGIDRPLLKALPVSLDVIIPAAKRILAKSEFLELDNIATDGVVMESPEIAANYGVLRSAVFAELDLNGCSAASDPMLRAPQSYPTKMRSDIWHGEPRYSMNVVIPLWGCGFSIVQFREPDTDTFRPLDDYTQGNSSGLDYEVWFCEGYAYYFDSMLMHQTTRIGVGHGVSIALRALYKERHTEEASPWDLVSRYKPLNIEKGN